LDGLKKLSQFHHPMPLSWLIPTDFLSRLRMAVALLLVAVLAPALFRLWCIKGLVRTIRIDGPSMAETLRGNHFRVRCGDCGITFRCDADTFPDDRRAVCPNCGFRENDLRDEDIRRGEWVLVDTWPYLWSAPRRGDVVMLVDPLPDRAKVSFAVKRIAALPGERPGIRTGDLFVDNDPIRKSWRELRDVAVLVHDNDYSSHSLPMSRRWLTQGLTSDWQSMPEGFRFSPMRGSDNTEWLTYQHWHCSENPLPRTAPARIQDNDGYNQAENRELNEVRDVLIKCRIKTETGEVVLELQDPPHVFIVHLRFSKGRFLVQKNGTPVVAESLPQSVASEFTLEAALCDGRFLLAYNRRLIAVFAYDGMPIKADKRQLPDLDWRLRIGASGGDVQISHLQVWRDIYYLSPTRRDHWQAEAPLPAEHYFLLGDNSPVSIDSRQWGGVRREQILGKVIALSSALTP
jgi:signal peptidase I